MAEKKKRGLFSWLGFGESTETEADVNPVHSDDKTTEAETKDALVPESNAESAVDALNPNDIDETTLDISEPKEADVAILSSEPSVADTTEAIETPTVDASADDDKIANLGELVLPENVGNEQEKPQSDGFFARLINGLRKTKANFGSGFINLFRGKKIDDELFEELEEQLLIADVGMDTTRKIIQNLTDKASHRDLKDGDALFSLLKTELGDMLKTVEQPLTVHSEHTPYVILMVGVNGVGKTTTIGKLAKKFQAEGKSVMLAAGDTFRAAAVEQLQVWGERNNVPVVAQHTGADSASVIFDAIESAKARKVDVVIADTAGRLQNKGHLMEELRKIVRVMRKVDGSAPHEIMLTVDAGTGQNAISQAKLFSEVAPVTGITLTKLDGTAKGGIIFALADQFSIPIRFIGIGEGIDDLRPFSADEFIEALFSDEE